MNPIRECLARLLIDFERIGNAHEELFDSEVREQAGNALMTAFVRCTSDYDIPPALGMFSDAGNALLRSAIVQFVDCAIPICDAERISGFHERLKLLQDGEVRTECGNEYDEFIGHTPPDWYDSDGNVLWDRVR